MLATARGPSHFGEHRIGWLILAPLGAIALSRRRREWLAGGAFVAHAIAVLDQALLVRRQRRIIRPSRST